MHTVVTLAMLAGLVLTASTAMAFEANPDTAVNRQDNVFGTSGFDDGSDGITMGEDQAGDEVMGVDPPPKPEQPENNPQIQEIYPVVPVWPPMPGPRGGFGPGPRR